MPDPLRHFEVSLHVRAPLDKLDSTVLVERIVELLGADGVTVREIDAGEPVAIVTSIAPRERRPFTWADIAPTIAAYDATIRRNFGTPGMEDTIKAVAFNRDGTMGAWGEVLDQANELGCDFDEDTYGTLQDALHDAFLAYQAQLRVEVDNRPPPPVRLTAGDLIRALAALPVWSADVLIGSVDGDYHVAELHLPGVDEGCQLPTLYPGEAVAWNDPTLNYGKAQP